MVLPPVSIRRSSFLVTMVPVLRPNSVIASPRVAVSRFRGRLQRVVGQTVV
jgi:hypothetical protein